MDTSETRIAFPSDDGEKISRHFGKAAYFVVASISPDGGVKIERRIRDKNGNPQESGIFQVGAKQGFTHLAKGDMFAAVQDCDVLVAGGMGQGSYDRAVMQGLRVILTGEWTIQKALDSFRAGALDSDLRRIHKH